MHFLGLDGGGSGCRAVLADQTGRILGRGSAGPANIASDLASAAQNIRAACDAAMAGFEGGDIRAVFGLAGANLGDAAEALAAQLPFKTRIVQDVTTSVRGALGTGDGIVAAIGTGSVFARQLGGVIHSIGGWGLRLGDEGSGAWIGRALGIAAARASDGFREITPLLRDALSEWDGRAGLIAFSLRATPADWAVYAPRVLNSDDTTAYEIRDQAEAEIRAAITLLQPASALPVTWIGGLGKMLALSDWPAHEALGTSLDGALAMAMEGRA